MTRYFVPIALFIAAILFLTLGVKACQEDFKAISERQDQAEEARIKCFPLQELYHYVGKDGKVRVVCFTEDGGVTLK